MSWSIIIFLYNEEGSIAQVIHKTVDVLQQKGTSDYELIIVNDGSIDNSHSEILSATAQMPNVLYINKPKNEGIGQALIAGYRQASKQNICAIPGDGQFDVNELLACPDFTTDYFVSFYRKRTNYNLYRAFLSKFNQFINRVFLGIQLEDVNWIKVYKKEHLDSIEINLNSSLIESEICAKLLHQGVKPIQIESIYNARMYGASKAGGLKTVSQALSELFRLILEIRRFKHNA